jgi:general secretion pathway protein J
MMRRTRGFTLLELLVAAMVLAVMAALSWRGLDGVARGRDAVRASSAASAQLALCMQQLRADVDNAHDSGRDLPAVSVAANGDLLIVRRAPGSVVTLDGRPPRDAGLLQVVRWGLRDGVWKRWASTPLGQRGALLAAMRQPGTVGLPMLDGISSARFLVFRYAGSGLLQQSGAWVNPYSAADTAASSPAQQAALRTPAGLRVTLKCAGGALRGTIVRAFLLENRQ